MSKTKIALESAVTVAGTGRKTLVICPFNKVMEYQKLLNELPGGLDLQREGKIKICAPFMDEQERVDRMEAKYQAEGYAIIFDESIPFPQVAK